ncbi:hypothetical protein ROJ8625_01848 [Roseivivax jejudonensis]|uniref:DoxX n=1 Tax=Roseivivax jejudonensis TaxID=1529041 RepID=A0A1X6Z3S7_9RHOB|nr:hypothetical protein [Roseivivax jejudonensis]SLN39446.1 hypothetical protein ROJ8625_01848 [Roseivivax jejudonensis]
MTSTPIVQCVIRIALAACLAYAVIETMSAGAGVADRILPFAGVSIAAALLAGLMSVVAIWLAFGVRTRVVALLGLALYTGHLVALPGFTTVGTDEIVQLAVVAALALPLIVFGGGRYSMVRAGWHNVI